MKLQDLKIGHKIQLAIAINVILAIILGEFVVRELLGFTHPLEAIAANLLLNGVIAFIYGLIVSRAITRPLKKVVEVLQVLASGDGDLTQRLTPKGNDEVAELSRHFNTFLDKLHKIIAEVAQSTHRLAAEAKQMQSIADESENQLKSQQRETDQAASAMNEMATTVQEVSRNAADAEASAREADSKTSEGANISSQAMNGINDLVKEVEDAATAINQLSDDVGNISVILDVIKDITEQTNLLALNAAIEAARAGEQGRGFAVVADEVRTLALRTQDSTHEIEEVITKLQSAAQNAKQVMESARSQGQAGAGQVAQVNESLSQITTAVMNISNLNTLIASATEEQSATTEEVNRNIDAINQATRVTADGAGRTTQTSQQLAELARGLEALVGQFKLSG
ncbi:hypothetical protein Tel_03175 [Candidatus Tenderia electrophaga]|jgi:methyl-accepting chemotaxis protein|uniref:Chemotaxis protein n=1 Tax=Candidatus Tenderia electrophaga TaxID=1748243 RepID=A0A0S2TAT7_9GAMM|nr:hypothetical protein Tel_03175 [Candidatus Tenderia electrophaga]